MPRFLRVWGMECMGSDVRAPGSVPLPMSVSAAWCPCRPLLCMGSGTTVPMPLHTDASRIDPRARGRKTLRQRWEPLRQGREPLRLVACRRGWLLRFRLASTDARLSTMVDSPGAPIPKAQPKGGAYPLGTQAFGDTLRERRPDRGTPHGGIRGRGSESTMPSDYSGVKFFRTSALARRRSIRWVTALAHRPHDPFMGRRDQNSRPTRERICAL